MVESHAVAFQPIDDNSLLDVALRISAGGLVVGVGGEIDLLTAPALGALINALADSGHPDVVLDLVALDFMDASGLRVLAAASARCRLAGGALTIRSPSSMALRILGLTGMLELVESGAEVLLPLFHPAHAPAVVAVPSRVGVAVPGATSDVVDATLRLVTALARDLVGGADGVSVTLRRHGMLSTVAATNDKVAEMDRDQYATGEGPCLSAAAEGRSFYVESLAAETRWPQFVPRAIDDGIASILSTPLMVAGLPVGALNIYSNIERAFGSHDHALAALFANEASGVLAAAGVERSVNEVEERIRQALCTREVIAQAQGAIMARQGISADAAYADLRRSARRQMMTVGIKATAILAATARDDLIGQAGR